MQKINSKITNGQALYFCNGAKQIIDNTPMMRDDKLNRILSEFVRKTDQLATVVNENIAKSPLEQSDTKRDFALQGFIDSVEFCRYSDDEAIIHAGEALIEIIEHYGGRSIARYNFAEQSSSSQALFVELSKPENMEKIELNELVSNMFVKAKESNEAFIQDLTAFNNTKATESATPAAYKIKHELLFDFNKLIQPYLNIMMIIEPTPYQTLHDNLSELVCNINEQANRHQTMLDKNREDETEMQ